MQLLIKIFQLLSTAAICDNGNTAIKPTYRNDRSFIEWKIIFFLLSWRANSWVAREMSAKRYKWRELFLYTYNLKFTLNFKFDLRWVTTFPLFRIEREFFKRKTEMRKKSSFQVPILFLIKTGLDIFLIFFNVTFATKLRMAMIYFTW